MTLEINYHNLSQVPYLEALKFQESLREQRIKNEISDQIVLLEHPSVFTVGKRKTHEDFLISHDEIKKKGIDIVETNRGGRVTYHGPGQLMAYFIFNIDRWGVKGFVKKLEEICIAVANEFGVSANASDEHPGVWVGNNKLTAIGLHLERSVSMHGIALNVNCDLEPYKYIVACGIQDKGITTLSLEAKKEITVDEVKPVFIEKVNEIIENC